ncbi:hypothetical protein Fmac_016960 [Flemingia macrophylla]|uniref:Retrovirus-related Pol polyprotein from transposon TNT 1-94 n=1 Tax=Flemingia macrophylla TaxID=520843 RepID=A0ABD1MJM9_9FABA
MRCIRMNISCVVGVVSHFLSNFSKEHWQVVKWILRYLKGTFKVCLYFGSSKLVLNDYIDAYMVGDVDYMKSTSGYMITNTRGANLLEFRLQKCVALSFTKIGYIVITKVDKELL